jgi:pimeloyl-ACP methyl ester carboxylesterase
MVSVPQKPTGFRSPIISYQHGTTFYDKETPSNDFVATTPPSIIASMGYIVVTADYMGYGASLGKKHPYLQSDPSALAVADFLTAAKQWLAEQRINTNGQLFLTGYSEGGYVTLAAQRALQATSTPITATVAGAGPYDLRKTLDILFSSSNVAAAISDSISNSLGLKSQDTSATVSAKYPGKLDEAIVDLVMGILIPKGADITFDKKFLMDYMADDYATMSYNSVYDWQATSPVRLTQGRDDETVPFENSTLALDAMRAHGTKDIELVECMAVPSNHENCIKPYIQTMTNFFSAFAQDL